MCQCAYISANCCSSGIDENLVEMFQVKSSWMTLAQRLLTILFSLFGLWGTHALGQTCAVPGWDGPATVSGVINTYHAGINTFAAGSTSIAVASLTGQRTNTRSLRVGDLILIMQMQDSVVPANAGLHEYAQIVGINFLGVLSLNRPLTNSYNFAMNTTNVRNWQVVYVPQYSSVTITGTVSADRWLIDPVSGQATGGVVAMDVAGNMTLNGTISVAGAGFRGGGGVNGFGNTTTLAFNTPNYFYNLAPSLVIGGVKGEGIQGTPIVVSSGTATVTYATLLGQGYTLGAAGQAQQGNAGGGANDGNPPGSNGNNSGGGGGGNGGAGGRGGNSWATNNVAGGFGGDAVTNSATRLMMGGGGGAGGGNNAVGADSVTSWPPVTSTVANGASGGISSSGARGGGIVLLRTGTIAGTGVIDADGYHAHNKTDGSDGGGGGGAGGTIYATANGAGGAGLTLRARGGWGGWTPFFDHGPGGGGGGGHIRTNLSATTNITRGQNGQDGCCAGVQGNGSPKAYNALQGINGTIDTNPGTPSGVLAGAQCPPNVAISKSTSTPLISASTGATAVYTISASNTGGAATNLYLFDVALPPGWTYLSSPAPTYTYSPAPPFAAGVNSSGAETVAAVLPAGFPVNSATSANSAAAVSLRANGAAPGVVPTAGNGTLSFGSFYLPQNGVINVSFVVSIPNTAAVGTYHNAAGTAYLDPTRLTTAARMISPLFGVNANRTGTAISANTAYASGGPLVNVLGTNYSGLQAGGVGENVRLLADLSVTKTGPATAFAGGTGTYSLVGRNLGRAIGVQTFSTSQATDVIAANVSTVLSANPIRITDTFPSGVSLDASPTGTNWTCTGVAGNTSFSCGYFQSNPSLAYPLASNTALPTITVPVLFASNACPAVSNFATISLTPGETATANNTSNAVATTVGCNAALSVTKTNGTSTLVAGSTTQYTVTFVNAGPAGAGGAVVKDQPSAGLSSCSVTSCIPSGTGVCPAAAQWPNFFTGAGLTLPSFASGATLNFIVSCGVTATGI